MRAAILAFALTALIAGPCLAAEFKTKDAGKAEADYQVALKSAIALRIVNVKGHSSSLAQ